MCSCNWYNTEPLFKIFSKDFPWFTSTKYANLRGLCSYTVTDYAYTTMHTLLAYNPRKCVAKGGKLWGPEMQLYLASFLLCCGRAVNLQHNYVKFRVE